MATESCFIFRKKKEKSFQNLIGPEILNIIVSIMFFLIILIIHDEKQQHLLRIVKTFWYGNKLLLDSGMNVFQSDKKFLKKEKKKKSNDEQIVPFRLSLRV